MNSNYSRKPVRYRKYSHMKYGEMVEGKETFFQNTTPAKALHVAELKKAGQHHTQKGATA